MQNEPSIVSEDGFQPRLVSVVIPSYNRAHLIAETVESVLAQTYRPLEVIVVDDGSTDDTRSIVEAFGPSVRYIHQENGGVSSARNTGFRNARGEYVALLDSDDVWLPWKLEAQVQLLERFPEVGMVWTDMRAIDADGTPLHDRYLRRMYGAYSRCDIEEVFTCAGSAADLGMETPEEIADSRFYYGDIFSQMILGNLVHTSTVLMRRERLRAVGGFDEKLRPAGEDYEFHLRTSAIGPIGLFDAPSMLYRIGQADAITAPQNDVHFARANLKTILHWLDREAHRIRLPRRLLNGCLAFSHAWVGTAELEVGNAGTARRHLLRSLRYNLRQPQLLPYLILSLLPHSFIGYARQIKRAMKSFGGLATSAHSIAFAGSRWIAEMSPTVESLIVFT